MSVANKSKKGRKTALLNAGADERSLLVIIVDCSPLAWGERDILRKKQDTARAAAGKPSVGPATLDEVLESVLAFCSAYRLTSFGSGSSSVASASGLVVVGVADSQSAVVYPRKDALHEMLSHPENFTSAALDTRQIRTDIMTGVADLVARAASKAAAAEHPVTSTNGGTVAFGASSRQAAMASAFSSALCLINRFLVAAGSSDGISALQSEQFLSRSDDDGVVALIGNSKAGERKKQRARAWTPRILIIQASEDRSRDYNAFMNCAFSAIKQQIVVDGCFLTAGSGGKGSNATHSSLFLEQVCDLTGGVYSAPSGRAQVEGALTEVLYSVFLPPISCRHLMNLPAQNKVDFRARCFDVAEGDGKSGSSNSMADMAFVCNLCLSIFKNMPKGPKCPTCETTIISIDNVKVKNKKQKT